MRKINKTTNSHIFTNEHVSQVNDNVLAFYTVLRLQLIAYNWLAFEQHSFVDLVRVRSHSYLEKVKLNFSIKYKQLNYSLK